MVSNAPALFASIRLPRMEYAVALSGGLGLAALLVTMLQPDDAIEAVELAPPVPVPAPAAPLPAPHGPSAQNGTAEGLVLHGVLGGGGAYATAIISRGGGPQMLARIGRELAPGVTLQAVERGAVILSENGNPVRLALADGGGISTLTPVAVGPAAPTAITSATQRAARTKESTVEFRLGLAPYEKDGDVTGYAIKPGADLPIFQRAGLRAGDVILSVNGRGFASEAEVAKLAGEIAISNVMVFEFQRDGHRQEARVEFDK